MFGFFKKRRPPAVRPRKELASPQSSGFTAHEIATINGSFNLIKAAVYDLGGEVPDRWNDSFSAFEARAPNGTLAQAWMVWAFFNGIQNNLTVSPSEEAKIADKIGRTYLKAFPDALDSFVGRACSANKLAFFAYLDRLDNED